MNIFALLMVFAVAAAAVIGISYIGSKVNAGPVYDTYGNTSGNTTNSTQAVMGNMTATGTTVGTGIIVMLAALIAISVLVALGWVAIGKYL